MSQAQIPDGESADAAILHPRPVFRDCYLAGAPGDRVTIFIVPAACLLVYGRRIPQTAETSGMEPAQ